MRHLYIAGVLMGFCVGVHAQTTATSARAGGIEPARAASLQQYIERYNGNDAGCTIGGQTFRNFKLRVRTSVLEEELKGQHPSPPKTASEIFVTPVNYQKDGRRWVGFHFTTGENGFEILGGDKLPRDYPHIKGHDVRNNGFMTNYEIRFEVHGTSRWDAAKVAYAGLATDRLVDGQWSEAANAGPGSRGNMGFHVRKIGAQGGYGVTNSDAKSRADFARLASVSRALPPNAKAPLAKDNIITFAEGAGPTSFEVRQGYWPDYEGVHDTTLGAYGIWFRMNCWEKTNTRWRADFIEYSFTNAGITDEGATKADQQ